MAVYTYSDHKRTHTMSYFPDYDYHYGLPLAFSHTFASEKTEKVFEQTTLVVG